ncbi:MAG: anthranilate phosphoribosyltransferase [Firmicutes bacterium]|nr:anthranilate phosphoribosyltransferase [Bacillota bacterium]
MTSEIVAASLEALSRGELLEEPRAYALMDSIMRGEATPVQLAGILMALRVRGETVDELTGFARAMRDHAVAVPVHSRPLMDTCGTGGDGSQSFNVSTVAAFVVAGAGLKVAKHGNRAATSRSGSADLLEALGVKLFTNPEDVARLIDEVGFGFLFAQSVHTSMRYAGPTRRELGVRTVFNILGPLTNPCAPDYQLVGVFHESWVRPVAEVLGRLGIRKAMVVHGHGGLDEVSLSGPTHYAVVDEGGVTEGVMTPDDLALPKYPPAAFQGGDPAHNAAICRHVLLEGERGPQRDLVVANAGVALYVSGQARTLKEGVQLAEDVINEGRAARVLEALVAASRAADRERRDA